MDLLNFTFQLSGVETFILIPPLVAFGISFFTSMGGISGAFLLLPFQMSVLGFTSPSVTATNFLFNVTGTPGGVYRYVRECRFVWPVALLIVAGIIPGVLIGYYVRITYLPDPQAFKFFVGCVLMLIALKLLKETFSNKAEPPSKTCTLADRVQETSIGIHNTRFSFKGANYTFATTRLLGTFVSSLTGVIFYSLVPINGAVATPDWLLGLLFGAGGLLGMYLGARTQKYVPSRWIKLMLGVVIISVALKYILPFISM